MRVSDAPGWRQALAVAVAVVGALLGLGYVWLTREQPPTGFLELEGRRIPIMQPVYVPPTPWWLYAMAAMAGALMASLALRVATSLRRMS